MVTKHRCQLPPALPLAAVSPRSRKAGACPPALRHSGNPLGGHKAQSLELLCVRGGGISSKAPLGTEMLPRKGPWLGVESPFPAA